MASRDESAAQAVKRWTARRLNRALQSGGLRLDHLKQDFDDRPLDAYSKRRIFADLARVFETWLKQQRLFDVRAGFDAAAITAGFFDAWLEAPFRGQQGGSRFNNLLWLFLIARAYQPALVVDSGTFEGASAWALKLGAPDARVLSFDIDLAHLKLRVAGVEYIEADWTGQTIGLSSGARFLTYFDDHVDQVRRLFEASDRGSQIAIFDDDYPVTSYYAMAPGPGVLPKIEFALDAELVDGQRLEWISRGQRQSWTVDRKRLDAGLARIASTERLPDTSPITGIQQTPYRIISVKPADSG